MSGDRAKGNIVLIGMPGAGKSTVGVLLAKRLYLGFIDTDVVLQARQGRRLKAIVDDKGEAGLLADEAECVLSLHLTRHVIATGGSVVYSKPAMDHLSASGAIVYLATPLHVLSKRRLGDLLTRGVVMRGAQSMEALYREREPLYAAAADHVIACGEMSHEAVVEAVIDTLGRGTLE